MNEFRFIVHRWAFILQLSVRPFIAEAADGLDLLPTDGPEFFPQRGDVHVDRAVEDGRVAAQRAVDDVVARQHPSRTDSEELEDAELGRGELYALSGVGHFVFGGIDAQLAAADNL